MNRVVLTVLTTLPLWAFAGCSNSEGAFGAPVLHFSAIPDQDETLLREKFAPIAVYLSGKLGVRVEYIHATTYADAIELFKNGDCLLAWFGGLSGVQARHAVPGARAIAQGEEDPRFFSYFIAHRDSGLAPGDGFPMGLNHKSFIFGSQGSTSGRLLPEHFIRKHSGKSPGKFFSRIGFSGSHDKTAELVESGAFDAGVLNYKVYDRRVTSGETDPAVCQVIWKTPEYSDYNFTAHPTLEKLFGPGFTDRLQTALLEMTDPALLSAFPRKRLIPATNEDFANIGHLALDLGFIR